MSNYKICFYVGEMTDGGIGRVILNLTKYFIEKKGMEVHYFLTNRSGVYDNQISPKVKVFRTGNNVRSQLPGLIKYLKIEQPNILFSAKNHLNIICIIACLFSFTKTQSVVSVHVDMTNDTSKYEFKIRVWRFINRFLAIIFYRFANKIVAVSNGVADNLAKRVLISKSKIKVIYNPVYVESNWDFQSEEIVKNLMSKYSRPIIISVGRLTEQKGYKYLIDSFKIVKEKHKEATLLILGEGEDRNKLQKQIQKNNLEDSIHMIGFVKDPTYYVKLSDVFVLSSIYEGFGNVLVEALGVGAKIVSTDCKSGPSEILENGKFGKLVKTMDVNSLAEGIINQIEAPEEDKNFLIERAKSFSLNNIGEEYLNLFEK